MKIRITKPVFMFPNIRIGEIYEAYEDSGGDFRFNVGGEQILVYPEECEVLEESENVVTSIDRGEDGILVATVKELVREELYKITFVKSKPYIYVGMVDNVSYIGKGRPSIQGADVFIYTPDGAQIIVDRQQFQSIRVEPYNED